MNEEKNNIGVQNSNLNSLPEMPTTPVGVEDKYGLPPMSNFTNFDNNYNIPSVDSNTSVFDLMDQFDAVNTELPSMNAVSSDNNQMVGPTNNPIKTAELQPKKDDISNGVVINQTVVQDIPMMGATTIQNKVEPAPLNVDLNSNVNNQTVPNLNSVPKMFAGGMNESVSNTPVASPKVNSELVKPEVVNVGSNNQAPVSTSPAASVGSVPKMFVGGMNNVVSNTPVASPKVNSTPVKQEVESVYSNNQAPVSTSPAASVGSVPKMFAGGMNNVVSNTPLASPKVNSAPVKQDAPTNKENVSTGVDNSNASLNNVKADNNMPASNNVSLNNTSIQNESDNKIENIPTTTLDVEDENSNTSENMKPALNNNSKDMKSEGANVKKTKKKSKKLLFIILLGITLLLVSAALLLGYFMFIKEDKLVCGLQDYSNEQFMIDESMVVSFKGNKMQTADFEQSITFIDDYVDKKDAYLEEIKNQYQGLGFNVSFIETELGFDINMTFSKEELESWYGQKLKNSSKNTIKKELRDSGYTCK